MKNVFTTTLMIASFGLLTACGGEEEREPVEAPPAYQEEEAAAPMGGMETEQETIIRPEQRSAEPNYGQQPMTEEPMTEEPMIEEQ